MGRKEREKVGKYEREEMDKENMRERKKGRQKDNMRKGWWKREERETEGKHE